MLTHLIKLVLARRIKPFLFQPLSPEQPACRREGSFLSQDIGLYIHIPFCKTLCDFCPYFKETYSPDKMEDFVSALLKELEYRRVSLPEDHQISSLYFGGGSPALALDYLPEILKTVQQHYGKPESIAMELHPHDISASLLDRLKELGVSMLSLGAQSFDEEKLEQLGRGGMNAKQGLALVKEKGFSLIDVDLIFALPGQTGESLESDFLTACQLGATQISTYPFIRFSYAGKRYKRSSRKKQRRLLNELQKLSESTEMGRSSVWTFGRQDCGIYSSVTRNNVMGFGPSATSLFRERFVLNSFSVEEYCRAMKRGTTAGILEMAFNNRLRKMYWLFWSSYNLHLQDSQFRRFFDKGLKEEFPLALKAGTLLGLLKREGKDYRLTRKGTLLFHRIEQIYTHQYIDKTWRICTANPRPKGIRLF